MVIPLVTAREEATELLTTFLVRKGIQVDSVDIEILVTIFNLFVRASFQEGAGKLRAAIIQANTAPTTATQDE